MFFSHLLLGFIISYAGYTPPSMLNITVSKIRVENNKKAAYQFVLGASLVVFIQFFLAVLITSVLHQFPQLIYWIKNIGVVVFSILSINFLQKGITSKKKDFKSKKNCFLFGISLSFINMFAIPFFVVAYSFLSLRGFINTNLNYIIVFAFGIFLGVVALLSSYVFLAQKFKSKLIPYTNSLNIFIGIITGFLAIYTGIKLYF